MIATVGVAELAFVVALPISQVHHPGPYPTPLPWHLKVGSLVLGSSDFMVLILVPITIAGLAIFLNRTRYGLAIRVSADNPERAQLAGISARRVSTLVWVIAGVLATLTVVLLYPRQGVILGVPEPEAGPSLLLRALAAALVGGMTSLPLALVGGLAVGMGESIVFANVSNPGVVDVVLLVVVLLLVLTRGRKMTDGGGAWSVAPRPVPVPDSLRQLWWVRHLRLLISTAALAAAVVLALVFTTASVNYDFSMMAVFAIIGLSVTVLTGWAGQLSLGQYTLVGLGAVLTALLVSHGWSFPVAVGAAALAALAVRGGHRFPCPPGERAAPGRHHPGSGRGGRELDSALTALRGVERGGYGDRAPLEALRLPRPALAAHVLRPVPGDAGHCHGRGGPSAAQRRGAADPGRA